MSSISLTVDQVFGGLQLCPKWCSQPEWMKNLMKPYIGAIPHLLAEHLSKPVTVRSWAQTRKRFFEYLLDYGFAEAYCDSISETKERPEIGPELVHQINSDLCEVISRMEGLLDGLEPMLKASGQTDRDILTGPKIGLNGTALQLFDQHKLTIAYLLKLQPELIVGNNYQGGSHGQTQ